MKQKFSVIVAAYNAEQYLEETLWSIGHQTYSHLEVIVVDDGSTDATAAIARQFCLSDPRFRLFRTPNRGISPARNLAAAHARGEWIAVCDADDTWHPEKLERQAASIRRWEATETEPLVALGTAGHLTNARGQPFQVVEPGLYTPGEVAQQRAAGDLITLINSSVVYRRDVFGEVGGYRAEYTPAEDTDLWMRLAERGVVMNLPDHLTGYRKHGSNVSGARYQVMMLHARRIAVNAGRRRSGLPEYSHGEFCRALRERGDLPRTRRELRWERYVTLSQTNWQNGRRVRGLLYRLLAALLEPGWTLGWLRAYLRERRWQPSGHLPPASPSSTRS